MEIKKQRVHVIDAIRGFSLLGILMANMLIFQYGIMGKDELHLFSISTADNAAHIFMKIAIEGSFMPIFTFLFGYSLIKMNESLVRKGLKPKRHLARRFIVLIIFGALHGMLLWEGDILLSYGITGFFLLLFVNRKKKTIFIWGITLLLLTSLIGFGMNQPVEVEEKNRIAEYVNDTIAVYGNGTYGEIKYHRNNVDPIEMPEYVYLILFFLMPVITAPLFLLGMYAAKNAEFQEINDRRKRYVITGTILTVLGLMMKSAIYWLPSISWVGIIGALGANILSLGYICLFTYLYSFTNKSFIIKAFESVGKLSLTNYLMQTIICTTIFYGYGFGFFGKMGVLSGILLSFVIYSCQLIISYYYLKSFKIGPFEKIMRVCTYLRLNEREKKKKKTEETYMNI